MLRIDRRESECVVVTDTTGLEFGIWVESINWPNPGRKWVRLATDAPESVVISDENDLGRMDRREGESITIRESAGVEFKVYIKSIEFPDNFSPWVRLLFDADKRILILREELLRRKES